LPIEGVTSKLIYDNLRPDIEKHLIHKEDILNVARERNFDVLMSLGAGDIENFVPQITEILSK
jgi:UDP-N-acetylmuramate--alanine ligase